MTETIVSIARIEQQAREAAALYDCVNDACPYSFYTEAGRIFKKAFMAARLEASIVGKPERGAASNTPATHAEPARAAIKGVAV